jgi:hypothetical protein
VKRSSAYWAANRYGSPDQEPSATAPLTDLPVGPAARFRLLRDGLRAVTGVAESVRFMGTTWRWAWEYGIGNRKLCWVHVVGDELSATFTLTENEEGKTRAGARLATVLAQAIEEGQRTGPVRWCWVELADRKSIEAFVRFAARKAEWLSERPASHRGRRARPSVEREEEAE